MSPIIVTKRIVPSKKMMPAICEIGVLKDVLNSPHPLQ